MTSNRARKAAARARQEATGVPYVVARRQTEESTSQLSPLERVMAEHPQLTSFGIGIFNSQRKSWQERTAELQAGRDELASREQDVHEVAAWLRANIAPIKSPGISSYGLKHLVERQIDRYVSNGEAIAAALVVGYPHRYQRDSPNMAFGMSRRDYNRLRG